MVPGLLSCVLGRSFYNQPLADFSSVRKGLSKNTLWQSDRRDSVSKSTNEALPASATLPGAADPETFAWRLRAVAFLSGASLMALEMAGVRLLEPHFGTTIYVWGSIIGIFLGSLSLGYWVGGVLADKHPRMTFLGGILLGAALLTFVIPWVAFPLCRALNGVESIGPRLRAVLGSLILYAAPSILMGMVSPFAVRLAARDVRGLGGVAGSLYAVSTLGSIIGTFLVAFVLTEIIGSKMIVFGVGTTLVLVSLICFLHRLKGAAAAGAAVGLLAILPGFLGARGIDFQFSFPDTGNGLAWDGGPADQLLEPPKESAYHRVAIVLGRHLTDPERKRRARLMYFNNQIESAVEMTADGKEIARPISSGCGYTKLLHLGVPFTGKGPERILVIGCGGGVGPQVFANDYKETVKQIDVVDIDPLIFEKARQYFDYPEEGESDVIRSHVKDGRLFLLNSTETWDYIILDAYTSGGRIPRHLISQEFFQLVTDRLTPDGVLVANVISAIEGDEGQLFRATWKTLDTVFANVYSFPRHRLGVRGENIILVATQDEFRLTSFDLNKRYLLVKRDILKRPGLDPIVDRALLNPPSLDDVPVLTDDFCPTDSMVYQ